MTKIFKIVKNVVVMSIKEYRKKNNEVRRRDYNNGRVRKAKDVFEEWNLKYGIWNYNFLFISSIQLSFNTYLSSFIFSHYPPPIR